ncbi:uncharacterized protein CXQ87_003710 [Candidozyma duobushaemuli]|uniref:NADH:flavin oxidoreductase/NADH oxidase N-terminal domain-containing protein n=2 Tax=Candidozyma TaxID=3303203 RepID=A0ABX8I8K9_9ASCO|nr:uncharacterized protein CXQ87_003710 [[Candida] duobushaemulonis]PVH15854.1 hypothetical protein CXQ87_003710 [[Candida] duobushaemulonis]QWU89444.1 hypothetical protein CA3LBN_003767 [[Candida] haemuloni]
MTKPVEITPLKNTKVFEPIKVGKNELSTRIIFTPSTRYRALDDHTPSDLQLVYYDDRSKYPGTLITTEGVLATEKTGSLPRAPGIFNEKHIKEWKKITDKIHENKSFVTIQLWALGRVADPAQNKKEGQKLKGVSAVYPDEDVEKAAKEAENELEAYTTEELDQLVEEIAESAKRSVEAGFDYVELHGATGYLFHQFFEVSSNKRTDKYGGSIENRSRFNLAVIDRITEEIGSDRLAIRLSPWLRYNGMKSNDDEIHPVATYGYFLSELQKRADAGKPLAYISVIEPRVPEMSAGEDSFASNEFIKTVWRGNLLRSGNYTYDVPDFKDLLHDLEDDRTLGGFSRYFIANPDLIFRLRDGKALTKYDRDTFYTNQNWGYNTYLKADEKKDIDEEAERAHEAAPISE